MNIKVKNIDITNCTYYSFKDINIENFVPNNIKLDKRSYKTFLSNIFDTWQ